MERQPEDPAQDRAISEWLVKTLSRLLVEMDSGAPDWLTPAWAGRMANHLVETIGIRSLWEHLGLWRQTEPDPEALDPLAEFLLRGSKLPEGLEQWKKAFEKLNWDRDDRTSIVKRLRETMLADFEESEDEQETRPSVKPVTVPPGHMPCPPASVDTRGLQQR